MFTLPGTSRRRTVGVVVALVGLLAAGALFVLPAAFATPAAPSGVQVLRNPEVRTAVHSDTSPPLRSMRPLVGGMYKIQDNDNPAIAKPGVKSNGIDQVIQRALGPLAMPTPIVNVDGQYNENGPLPPDTNGDVGRNNYVQIVNSMFAVYDKSGNLLYGPVNINTLWQGFGGVCESHNDGDPIALYDAMADRWLLSQFTSSAPYMQCIALSTSGDPTGSYYRYGFLDHNSGNTLGDYPKFGIWPDGYYMSTNEFGGSGGGGNYAYDRVAMLQGNPGATQIYFHGSDQGLLPTDLDSAGMLPPAGSPNYFLEWYSTSQLHEFKFHADFANPANSTYTGPFAITVAAFSYPAPSVPEPDTSTLLDNLSDRLMYRLAYRNFGAYELLVVNHTVNAGGVDGVRWYELRDPNNAAGASVYQQGTYAPGDGLYRWMGSIAQDRAGDIAVGFSFGNATTYPGIAYAGRVPGDPLGTLGQGETTLFAGTGSEDFPAAHRWGDYSAMQIDPADDCTFWYTQMYWRTTGERNWRTRIGSFKFPGCAASGTPTPVATATGPVPTATNTPGPAPTLCPGSIEASGSITDTDATQTGRLGLFDPKSSCAAPKSVAGMSDTLTRHYDSYTYTNSTGSAECVTVSIVPECSDNAINSIAYLGSFNPSNPQANYLADGGASGPGYSYSFSLGAGQTAVVVVNEVSPNIGCELYSITINPCAPGGATPSPTSPPVTPSTTPSPTATATPLACGGPPAWAQGPTQDPARGLLLGDMGTDGKFYVAGGQSGDNTQQFGDVDRYNPTTDAWEQEAPLPVPVGQDAVAATGGKVFVAGGCSSCNSPYVVTSTLQIYDIATGTWTFGASLPAPVEAAAGAALNGKFYVIGGDDGTAAVTTAYIYDIATNTWSTGAALPDANGRTNTAATVAGGLIYVFGGAYIQGGNTFPIDTMLSYDPTANSWAMLASANLGGAGNYARVSPFGTGQLFITDGGDGSFNPVATTHVYDIATNSYTAGPTLNNARLGHAQGTLPDGRVIVYAGMDTSSSATNSTELLTTPPPCTTATPTAAPSATATATEVPGTITPIATATDTPGPGITATAVPSETATPGPTNTPGPPTATETPCPLPFSDVHPTDYFYVPVQYLYCHGVISGYADNTFRPYNSTTRAQMVKIVVLGFGLPTYIPPGGDYTFADVKPDFPFFDVIETAAHDNVVSGYDCGGPGEPCDAQNRPYFRPYNNVTRGQLSKIDVVAAGWDLQNPPTGSFEDVLPNTAFYTFVETAYCHGIISGYDCGGPGEPCGPNNRPYFRQGNDATRGQISKIVYLSITGTGSCNIPTVTK